MMDPKVSKENDAQKETASSPPVISESDISVGNEAQAAASVAASSLPPFTEPEISNENEQAAAAAAAILADPSASNLVPFVRYDLKSSAIRSPLPMPSAMVERQLPLESWNDLWIKVQPIVRTIEFYDGIFNTILIALTIGTVILMLAFIIMDAKGLQYNFLFGAVAVILLFALFFSASGNIRTSQLQQLRLLFRDEQDRTFASYDYTLECEFEWVYDGIGMDNTYGFRLYFLPAGLTEVGPTNTLALSTNDNEGAARHGYLRILLHDAGLLGCCWTPISLAYLTQFKTIPTGFESLPDWSLFSSELFRISEKCLATYQIRFASQWTCVVLIVIMFANGAVDDFLLFLVITSAIIFLLSSCFFKGHTNERSFWVKCISSRLVEQGAFLECRTVYKFHQFLGTNGVTYFYLFPLQTNSIASRTTGTPPTSSQ